MGILVCYLNLTMFKPHAVLSQDDRKRSTSSRSSFQTRYLPAMATNLTVSKHSPPRVPILHPLAMNSTSVPNTVVCSHPFLRYSMKSSPFLMNAGATSSTLIPTTLLGTLMRALWSCWMVACDEHFMHDPLSSPSVISHYGWGESILILHKPTLLTHTTCSLIPTGNLSCFALWLGLISTGACWHVPCTKKWRPG